MDRRDLEGCNHDMLILMITQYLNSSFPLHFSAFTISSDWVDIQTREVMRSENGADVFGPWRGLAPSDKQRDLADQGLSGQPIRIRPDSPSALRRGAACRIEARARKA